MRQSSFDERLQTSKEKRESKNLENRRLRDQLDERRVWKIEQAIEKKEQQIKRSRSELNLRNKVSRDGHIQRLDKIMQS